MTEESCPGGEAVPFSPDTFGRLMDLRAAGIGYEILRNRALEERQSVRLSGRGKNMGPMGSLEPSRYSDTFVGNFRRAGTYKKLPARTEPGYEYWLDGQDRPLAVLSYTEEPPLRERLGTYYYETYLAYEDGGLTVYACFANRLGGVKHLDYVYGFRREGDVLLEKAVLDLAAGERLTTMTSQLYAYGADGALASTEEYRLESPGIADAVARIAGLPPLPVLTYRGVPYSVLHHTVVKK